MTNSNVISQPGLRINFFSGVSNFEMQFIILGGLVFYLPVLLFLGEPALSKESVAWNIWINLLATAPHTTSTYVRLHRKVQEKKVHWVYGWPAYGVVFGAMAGCALAGKFLECITVAAMWQSFHYLRQVFGVARIYSGKNTETELGKKLTFWAYHLAVPLFVFGRSDMLYRIWNGKPSDTFIPMHVPDLFMTGLYIIAGVGLLIGLVAEGMKLKNNASYNPTGLLILLLYFAVHYYGFLSTEYFLRGFFFISIFHAVQYIGIVYWLERKGRVQEDFISSYLRKGSTWIGLILFWSALGGLSYGITKGVLVPIDAWWAMFTTVALNAVSGHHYVVDTVIWKAKAGR